MTLQDITEGKKEMQPHSFEQSAKQLNTLTQKKKKQKKCHNFKKDGYTAYTVKVGIYQLVYLSQYYTFVPFGK